MPRRLISTDLDGTIVFNGMISLRDREAMARWRAAGNLLVINTGRSVSALEHVVVPMGLEFDNAILYTGAAIVDEDIRVRHSTALPSGVVGGVGLAVDLGPVAGGQDGGFGGQRLQVATQIGQGRADRLLGGEGELLTQRHGRRVVVESERQQRHVECIYTSCMPCGRQISKHAPPVG